MFVPFFGETLQRANLLMVLSDLYTEVATQKKEALLCPIHVVTYTLISNLSTDYIQKRRGEPGLFSFEYNLSPNLISK